MIKLFQEFKEFAVKGNMIDIAIGVIIGAAFNKVIDVLVKEVFLPPLTYMTDGVTIENKKWVLKEAVVDNGAIISEEIAIKYGKLLEVSIDFLIIGFTVFVIVKFMNRLKNKAQDPKNEKVRTPKEIELLDKISNQLEKQNELLLSKNKKETS
ncbi:large-conductance mechanosensitive channel [Dokdonia pacifica]|uniref:Large-conductance mechanosensitive channel n=1 Tax=Dokdonia pacifica TaxID=1627892 RepID=A0A239DDC7_9FLAO|nr:large-conductance mechanosensitive channel [Dokdonia pacifica]SNS30395.1 large conductance mechanosensitive channel [Dokdonia pacifica]